MNENNIHDEKIKKIPFWHISWLIGSQITKILTERKTL